MKSISLYVDNDTYLTRMHSFTKLCYILTAITVSLVSGKLWMFGVFIGISMILLISGKVMKKTFPLIVFSFTILLAIFIIHGLFHNGNTTILFSIGPAHFYKEGILYATKIGLNILNILFSFAIFVLTTKPSVFVEDLERIGISTKFGYIVTSVFQIVPQMSGSMNTIIDAQRSRGMETEGNLLTRMKSFIPLISPVVMSSLINTRERAIALEVRGFSYQAKKTYLFDHKMGKIDIALCVNMLVIIALTIIIQIIL